MMNYAQLPDLVLLDVFSRLKPRWLSSAICACKNWRRVGESDILWKNLCQSIGVGRNLPVNPLHDRCFQQLTLQDRLLKNQFIEKNLESLPINPNVQLSKNPPICITDQYVFYPKFHTEQIAKLSEIICYNHQQKTKQSLGTIKGMVRTILSNGSVIVARTDSKIFVKYLATNDPFHEIVWNEISHFNIGYRAKMTNRFLVCDYASPKEYTKKEQYIAVLDFKTGSHYAFSIGDCKPSNYVIVNNAFIIISSTKKKHTFLSKYSITDGSLMLCAYAPSIYSTLVQVNKRTIFAQAFEDDSLILIDPLTLVQTPLKSKLTSILKKSYSLKILKVEVLSSNKIACYINDHNCMHPRHRQYIAIINFSNDKIQTIKLDKIHSIPALNLKVGLYVRAFFKEDAFYPFNQLKLFDFCNS